MVKKVACAGFEDIPVFYTIKEAMIARFFVISATETITKGTWNFAAISWQL